MPLHQDHDNSNMPHDLELLVLVINAEQVRSGAIGHTLTQLLHLTDERDQCRRLANRVVFYFDGFAQDPRPDHDIPECRNYLLALNEHWPYWLHFLAPHTESWLPLLCSLCDATTQYASDGSGNVRFDLNPIRLKSVLQHLVEAMQRLHQHHQVPDEEAMRVFSTSMNAIEAMFGKLL